MRGTVACLGGKPQRVHVLYVSPGADDPEIDYLPERWKTKGGSPRQIKIRFIRGRRRLPDALARYLFEAELAYPEPKPIRLGDGAWRRSDAVISHIVAVRGICPEAAGSVLRDAALVGLVRTRGPKGGPVDWSFLILNGRGRAIDIRTLRRLDGVEVAALDVVAAWPERTTARRRGPPGAVGKAIAARMRDMTARC